MQETQVQSLGQEDPLEKEMATHSSVLAWKIPWTEEPGGLQSTGSQRVQHNLAIKPPIRICKGCNPTQKWQMGVTEKHVQDLKVSFTICLILPSAFLWDQRKNLAKVLDIFVKILYWNWKHCFLELLNWGGPSMAIRGKLMVKTDSGLSRETGQFEKVLDSSGGPVVKTLCF